MEQEKIWNHFQTPKSDIDIFRLSTPRYIYLANQVSTGAKALNIGVGRGGLERVLLERNVDVYCLDPGSAAIEHVRVEIGLGEKAQVGRSEAIPFSDASFDIVIMTEVLEHLEQTVLEKTISEVHRVLKPNGKFIGTVPADEDLNDGLVMCPHCGECFHRWGHVQRFDAKQLEELLHPTFPNVQICRHYFGDWSFLNWKGRFNFLLKKVLLKLGSYGSSENYAFVASKRVT